MSQKQFNSHTLDHTPVDILVHRTKLTQTHILVTTQDNILVVMLDYMNVRRTRHSPQFMKEHILVFTLVVMLDYMNVRRIKGSLLHIQDHT